MNKSFSKYFKETYYKKLLTPNGNNPVRNRADGFYEVFKKLEELNRMEYRILETGCVRKDHGELCFGDDGCATVILDDFVKQKRGRFTSVDIKRENVDYARTVVSEQTLVILEDSVKYLSTIPAMYKFDLIYLDSFDIEKNNPHPSQLHHMKEIAAVMKNTKKDTIIMIDDHDAFFTGGQIGKGNYVKDFLLNIGAEILHEGYQIAFILNQTL